LELGGKVVPRGGVPLSKNIKDLHSGGTNKHPIASLCFLKEVSHLNATNNAGSTKSIGAEDAQSKLQENISVCPSPVPVAGREIRGVRRDNGADGNCHPPLYIVDGVSSPSAIPFHTAENIILAAAFAGLLGFPLTYHMIVRWTDEDVKDHEFILRRIAEWQRYNVGQPVFVWARETKDRHHTHILVYIPRHLANRFRKLARQWLREAFDLRGLSKGTLWVRKSWSRGDPFEHTRNKVRYILKGADADTRLIIGSDKSEPGFVGGKRAGFSQGLGEAARKKAGGVIASGLRKPNAEMLRTAINCDQRREEKREQFRGFSEAIQRGVGIPRKH